MEKSIFKFGINIPSYPSLKGKHKTDVLIIGGGIAGILCGYYLKQSSIPCVLLEREKILCAATGKTTAKITSQQGLIYHKLLANFGAEKARLFYKASTEAIGEYKRLSKIYPCEFEEKSSFVYAVKSLNEIEKELNALDELDIKHRFTEDLEIPVESEGAVELTNQAQFNPFLLLYALSEQFPVYENSPVLNIKDNTAFGEGFEIKAQKIIIATHFPFINRYGGYFLKLYQKRSYSIAFENIAPVNGMYIGDTDEGFSFRDYKNCVLIGGGSSRTGTCFDGYRKIEEFAVKHYPSPHEICRFAASDTISLDSAAYIGKYSKNKPDLFVATGFGKWGMANSMISAKLITDEISGKRSEYEELFSPSRSILHPQLAVNLKESAKNLLSFSTKRCTHLGCALKWNEAERTWDCPCHGSRFTENGEVLENPAKKNL